MDNIDLMEICDRFNVKLPNNTNRVVRIRDALDIYKNDKRIFDYLLNKYTSLVNVRKDREIKQLRTDVNNISSDYQEMKIEVDRLSKSFDEAQQDIDIKNNEIHNLQNEIKNNVDKVRYVEVPSIQVAPISQIKGSKKIDMTKTILSCALLGILIIICTIISLIPMIQLKDTRKSDEFKYREKYKSHKRYESIF